MTPRFSLTALALASAALLLTACINPGPARVPLAATSAEQVGLSAPSTELVLPAAAMSLGDAKLAALIEQALATHPSLSVARARVQRAQALAGLTQANSGAQAALSADLARQRYTENGLYPAPVAGSVMNSGTLQLGGSWELDFFGRHAAELASALGQARAAQADAAAAATALSQQIARSYVDLARKLAQQDLLTQSLAQREEILRLTRQRVEAGLDDRQAISPAEVALQDVRVQQAALAEQTGTARHQLAVLSGLAPQALGDIAPQIEALRLPELPSQVGADLLGRRADVVAARWRVEAASQEVGAARSQFYPNVNLSSFVGLNALGLGNVLQTSSLQWGVTPALRLPLFDAGRLRAQLGVRQAELDLAIAQYNAVVLDAAREASDGLSSLQALAPQQQAQASALASAQAGWALAQQRRRAGLGGALPELNAQSTVLTLRQQALVLRAHELDTGLVLTKALGGGWADETPALAALR